VVELPARGDDELLSGRGDPQDAAGAVGDEQVA
jgi:hypothetical protein